MRATNDDNSDGLPDKHSDFRKLILSLPYQTCMTLHVNFLSMTVSVMCVGRILIYLPLMITYMSLTHKQESVTESQGWQRSLIQGLVLNC